MMDQQDERPPAPERREERDLVQVLDDEVEAATPELGANVPRRGEPVRVAAPDAMDLEAVDLGPGRRARPSGRNERDLVPPPRQAAEDLVQVDLRAAGLGVQAILPVQDE